jgi:hypothetical protein
MNSEREPDPYAVLNLPRTASASEIRAAYRALALKYHPDRHQGNPLAELASARLAEINRAYETLCQPGGPGAAAHPGEAGAPPPWGGSPTPGAPQSQARTQVEARSIKRLVLSAVALVAVPLILRTGGFVIRGLVGLARDLFEATALLPGGRPAAVAVLALVILGGALLRRPKGRR